MLIFAVCSCKKHKVQLVGRVFSVFTEGVEVRKIIKWWKTYKFALRIGIEKTIYSQTKNLNTFCILTRRLRQMKNQGTMKAFTVDLEGDVCLYWMSLQSIQKLLGYFSLGHSDGLTIWHWHPWVACVDKNMQDQRPDLNCYYNSWDNWFCLWRLLVRVESSGMKQSTSTLEESLT